MAGDRQTDSRGHLELGILAGLAAAGNTVEGVDILALIQAFGCSLVRILGGAHGHVLAAQDT